MNTQSTPSMRAKLRVTSVEPRGDQERLTFCGVSRSSQYPEDGSDEDNTYAKFSPSVELGITIANPNLVGKFKVGDTFYVDFTPVG
jgi:hypothetical protein